MPRYVGPSEYGTLVKELKVTPSTWGTYFEKGSDGKGFYIKDQYDPKAQGQSPLANTLPPENPANVATPFGQVDQLSALKMVMKNMSQLALKQGLGSGTEALLGGLEKQGMGPSQVSGGVVANIVNFVENQVKNPIQNEFEQMSNIIDTISTNQTKAKGEARDQISQLISTGMWNKMKPDQQQKIWSAAGYTGAPQSSQNTSSFQSEDADGNVWLVTYDTESGNVIRKQNLGGLGTPSRGGGPGAGGYTDEEIKKYTEQFNNELFDPKALNFVDPVTGKVKQVATKGEEKQNPRGYITREQMISRLEQKYPMFDPMQIADRVYKAYGD